MGLSRIIGNYSSHNSHASEDEVDTIAGNEIMGMTILTKQRIGYKEYLIFYFSILLASMLFLWFKRWKTKRLLHQLPTVMWRPKFFSYQYGDSGKMSSRTITNILKRMTKLKGPYGCYGTVYGISTPIIHIAHPDPVRAVLRDLPSKNVTSEKKGKRRRSSIAHSSGASKAPAYNHFFNFCGQGVFTADGDEWRAKRASVLHCLMLRKRDRIETEGYRSANLLVKDLLLLSQQCEENNGATNSSEQNIVPILQRATLGLIYRYLTHDTMDIISIDSYLAAITQIRMILLAQSRSAWFLLPRWCYKWFSPMYYREERVLLPIRRFGASALKRAKPDSPLGQLHQSSIHQSSKDLLDEAITLLFAGQDTSAATLSWTLHLLSLHPDIQDRLADEVRSTSDFTKLPLLDAVLKESMRLYPVAPFIVRHLVQDVTVSKKLTLPKNSFACIWIYSLHRNPNIWKANPEKFIPERWMNGQLTELERASYIPFCAGARNCLGQSIAQTWLRILLGTLMKSIEFIDDRLLVSEDGKESNAKELYKDMQAGFTVLPLGGVHMRIKTRK